MATKRKRGPKTVARSYFEAIGERDLDAMVEHYESGALDHIHGVAELRVPGTYREWFAGLFRAFPDFEMEAIEIAASGELAGVRWRASGTFRGSGQFEGLDPNDARVEIEGCDMLTIRDELIRENHAYMNAAELGRQLGALPPAGSVAERGLLAAVNLRTLMIQLLRGLRDRRS
jgi:predicted ester cyclase